MNVLSCGKSWSSHPTCAGDMRRKSEEDSLPAGRNGSPPEASCNTKEAHKDASDLDNNVRKR